MRNILYFFRIIIRFWIVLTMIGFSNNAFAGDIEIVKYQGKTCIVHDGGRLLNFRSFEDHENQPITKYEYIDSGKYGTVSVLLKLTVALMMFV